MTHSQRCTTAITVVGVSGPFDVASALAEVDGVLVRTGNTLPRGGELLAVHRAHAKPQFVEDALRAALAAVSRALSPSLAFERLEGMSRSLESIHAFDLTAATTLTPAAAAALLASR
jgi:GTP cyclohydrolase FolE2